MPKRPKSEYFVRSCQQLFITKKGTAKAKLTCLDPWRQMTVSSRRIPVLEAMLRTDGYKKERVKGGAALWQRRNS